MVAPFILGGLLALWIRRVPGLFSEKVTDFEAVLFLGAAMSITAFPMLARIIYERGITGTSLGTLALAAGAIDDATAWCILAIVLASFGGGPIVAIQAIAGGLLYGLFTLTICQKLLRRLGVIAERNGEISPTLLGVTLMLLMLGSWTTDAIGIHSVLADLSLVWRCLAVFIRRNCGDSLNLWRWYFYCRYFSHSPALIPGSTR
jgi:Kef-type K+ transport system membrane component KefB